MTHFLLQSVISIYVPTPNESPFICAAVAQRIYSIMATSGLNYERKWTIEKNWSDRHVSLVMNLIFMLGVH